VIRCALAAVVLALVGCGDGIQPIPGTTLRVEEPESRDYDLALRIFTDEDDCTKYTRGAPLDLCLPHVDRESGEVRISYAFELDGEQWPLPAVKEHVRVGFQGTQLTDSSASDSFTITPHDPETTRQLFILLIDGSSSMSENNRMAHVRQALVRADVKSAFFPQDKLTGAVILQFTQGQPQPVGGELKIIRSPAEFDAVARQLRVRSGYTHLYDAIEYATGPLLQQKVIKDFIQVNGAVPTVVALTDGFNNMSSQDECKDNAPKLRKLLEHLRTVRAGDGVDIRTRPSVYTVGLGHPIRPRFQLPEDAADRARVWPRHLCGNKLKARRIDGDLERHGIDNPSLEWIAAEGGGKAYVQKSKKELATAFKGAAASRFGWFELRFRKGSFYLRRAFRTRIELVSFARAEGSVVIHPNAWIDGPPGIVGADGWTRTQPRLHMLTVLLPTLGMLLGLSFLGATGTNLRRSLARARSRKKDKGKP
jgi:hypothetical protein